jgi:hypothetical protein
MKSIIISRLPWIAVPMIIAMMVFPACSKRSMQGAGQGAATGAVVGAVGGMVSALVFGGNVGEAAARGAVYAGATGAAAGAMSGAAADSNQKKAQEAAELEALRKRLGDDAFQGLEALVQCKHEVAQGYGRTAAKSSNPDFALAPLAAGDQFCGQPWRTRPLAAGDQFCGQPSGGPGQGPAFRSGGQGRQPRLRIPGGSRNESGPAKTDGYSSKIQSA